MSNQPPPPEVDTHNHSLSSIIDKLGRNFQICRICLSKKMSLSKLKNPTRYWLGKKRGPISNEVKEKIKQTCLKKYGVECSFQSKEIKEKIKQTCLKRYGVENPSQNPEIALKQAKAQNNSFTLMHWYSHEEIVCVASYEKKTVEYFNKNKIDYNWQVQTFLMPNGKTFRPDCYLPDENKWIEI
ncbi:hypothetical protein LCGC14_3143890, partial [marine sediment metagenome]